MDGQPSDKGEGHNKPVPHLFLKVLTSFGRSGTRNQVYQGTKIPVSNESEVLPAASKPLRDQAGTALSSFACAGQDFSHRLTEHQSRADTELYYPALLSPLQMRRPRVNSK